MPKWNLTLLVHQNTGKENRYRIGFFAIFMSTLWRFHRANKKSVIYTLSVTKKGNNFKQRVKIKIKIFKRVSSWAVKILQNCSKRPQIKLPYVSFTWLLIRNINVFWWASISLFSGMGHGWWWVHYFRRDHFTSGPQVVAIGNLGST